MDPISHVNMPESLFKFTGLLCHSIFVNVLIKGKEDLISHL